MAIIAYDGFDHYTGAADMMARSGKLQWSLADGITTPGRGGFGQSALVRTTIGGLATPVNKITIGFGISFVDALDSAVVISMIDNLTGTAQCAWLLNSQTGTITFTDASGSLIATALNSIGTSGWYFVELQNQIGPATGGTTGSAALRINNQAIASFPDLTGLNTQRSANNSVSGIEFQGGAGLVIDDFYCVDGTTGPGSYPCNSFLGDNRTATLFAISDSLVSWTPQANLNWQEISEVQFDGDTSYNRSNTAGATDLFNPQALPGDINQVICVGVTTAVRLEDAGARLIAPVIQVGGMVYVGTPQAVNLSYLYITSYWPVNPYTGASWTTADVDGCQFGYKIVS